LAQAPGFWEQKSVPPDEEPVDVLPPPVVPGVVPSAAAPPVAAPLVVPEAPPVPAVPLLEGVDGVTADVPEDDDEVDGDVVEEGVSVLAGVEDELSFALRLAAGPPIEVLAGAISACGFLGTASWVALLPPQADRPTVVRSIRAEAVARRGIRRLSPRER
jgi:hypothetical protein